MPRTLRPRNTKVNYANLNGQNEDEDTADEPRAGPSRPSRRLSIEDEEASGSDFAGDAEGPKEDEEEVGDAVDEDDEMDVDGDTVVAPGPAPQSKEKGKGKQPRKVSQKAQGKQPAPPASVATTTEAAPRSTRGKLPPKPSRRAGAASIAHSVKRNTYALPTPSVQHRHRAIPIYIRSGGIERLDAPPPLFGQPSTRIAPPLSLKSILKNSKAWGYNVGPGPLWELAEDKGWYKEALTEGENTDTDGGRRPLVHQNVPVKTGWKVLTADEARTYLPTDDILTEEGEFQPPPPIKCWFGPFGTQTQKSMNMFDSINLSTVFPARKSHVLNAGAPVWGIDWCPTHPAERVSRSHKQYLAVAPSSSRAHTIDIGVKVQRPFNACIQIWSLAPEGMDNEDAMDISSSNAGYMRCEMVICVDSGPAHEVKWCPLPSHDSESASIRPRKLGILSGTFEDGTFSVYVVPDPRDVTPPAWDPKHPVYVYLPEPLIRIELEETCCWSLDWANSDFVAIGTTHGIIAVYDLETAFKQSTDPSAPVIADLFPTHYLSVHQSAIRAITFVRAPPTDYTGVVQINQNPIIIASGGYDGLECLTDLRDGRPSAINRTRDVITTMAFSSYDGGPITIDHENIIKSYSASPSMLGRGHTLMDPLGPVWSVSVSDYHPQLAAGCADGACLTTNALRSTRRGGLVPFFVHKVYQLDYSRILGEFRMLEMFLPTELRDGGAIKKPAPPIVIDPVLLAPQSDSANADTSNGKAATPLQPTERESTRPTGAWPAEVGVNRVVWNNGNGLGSVGMLASATASGLCRVDVNWGRWMRDKVPYGGLERIWSWGEDGDDDDSDVE
ncbi:hypothetical protein BDN72DRAFT_889630 [Pluteus cervinus]|uniref:Uncharacterized protein n=1 Tax=Pluteus cervinus TaxID=181527 RepID=A0ACD3AF32_9AGAR|nr:hypothetical protein BDN72DRAFT_889630 [Pluteus cervinus]